MINLMPDNAKQQLRAARTNVLLVRYIVIIFFASLFLLMTLGGSYYLLNQTKQSAQQLIDANDSKSDVYDSTKTQVGQLTSSLSETKSLLDEEIRYSNVLVNLAQLMPPNTVFGTLTIDETVFTGTPVELTVYAKSTSDALALQSQFQGSPHFSTVNFQAISETGNGIDGYPVSAVMTVTLNRSISE
jgi:hypothetical protein